MTGKKRYCVECGEEIDIDDDENDELCEECKEDEDIKNNLASNIMWSEDIHPNKKDLK